MRLDNAIKYTPQGGRITVRAHRAGPRVRVEVEDTGVGISPEHLGHVFKRFYRAEPQPNEARNGVGLGLAIAKSAVAAHGGEIWLESQLGRGTVLSVELPLMEGTSTLQCPKIRPGVRRLPSGLDRSRTTLRAVRPSFPKSSEFGRLRSISDSATMGTLFRSFRVKRLFLLKRLCRIFR